MTSLVWPNSQPVLLFLPAWAAIPLWITFTHLAPCPASPPPTPPRHQDGGGQVPQRWIRAYGTPERVCGLGLTLPDARTIGGRARRCAGQPVSACTFMFSSPGAALTAHAHWIAYSTTAEITA
jgi:hypothetical protein